MRYLAVKNWEKHQHYKDRNPPWIKLSKDVLADYEISCLHDASKAHLMLIWVLASQLNNRIPDDPTWVGKRIGATTKVNLIELIDKGFLYVLQDASITIAECSPETEAYREETETDLKEKYTKEKFIIFWKSYPRKDGSKTKAQEKYRDAILSGINHDDIIQALVKYKLFVSEDHKKGGNLSFAHAATWLNQKRWESDYSVDCSLSNKSPRHNETYEQYCERTGQTPVYDEVANG